MAYTDEGMTKISSQKAQKLFNDGQEVYLLYPDNTEAVMESVDQIEEHEYRDGQFGVE
ncbi:hypothetical protein [Psychrobacillus sp. FSL H8-0510]|uniref:hypothetical protein n=1 Tax=Psychrobacillus sp. FSL H8-0510 TaxID=2921394 RepID=UPI0030F5BD7E